VLAEFGTPLPNGGGSGMSIDALLFVLPDTSANAVAWSREIEVKTKKPKSSLFLMAVLYKFLRNNLVRVNYP
jgi:hypothetical protein